MEDRHPQVVIRPSVKSRWAGKVGQIRCWLDPKHALVDLEEPRYKATLKFHKREMKICE